MGATAGLPVPPPSAAVANLIANRPESPEDRHDLLAGVTLVELERDTDVTLLRRALATDPHVAAVSRVPVRHVGAIRRLEGKKAENVSAQTPPGIAAAPPTAMLWNLQRIAWEKARARNGFRDADAIKVAVLDTGIDLDHPDLTGRVSNYTHAHPDLPGASSPKDIVGHGTHVSGIIAAGTSNGFGINGICRCELHVWKIFADEPEYIEGLEYQYVVNDVMYLRALADCLEQRMDVVNLSISGRGLPSDSELELFGALVSADTAVVAAMGNERQAGSPTSYPAAVPGAIAVGATGLDDRVALFSNAGNHICLAAPGVAIWSTLPQQPGQTGFHAARGADGTVRQGKPMRREMNYDAWPGTSMAAPHVSAAIALHRANHGRKSLPELRQALAQSVDKVPSMNSAPWHPDYGFGRLNLDQLVLGTN